MNLQEEIKIMKERIAELEELVKEEQEFPQDGDKYWYMDDEGAVFCEFYNHYIDKYHQEIGNIFRTEEEAKFAVEKLKVEAELRKFGKSPNVGEEDWFIVCTDSGEVYSSYAIQGIYQGVIYFESEEKVKQAVATVGAERIKKYLFGVEE